MPIVLILQADSIVTLENNLQQQTLSTDMADKFRADSHNSGAGARDRGTLMTGWTSKGPIADSSSARR